jgi:tetratricopeptide (TPR) repeat protein
MQIPNPRRVFSALAAGVIWTVGVAVPSAGHVPRPTDGRAAPEAQPQSEPTDQRIDRLIEQLGHQDYFVRQQAEAELAKLSFEAFDALQAATTHADLEIAARARYLLRLIRVQWTTESDPPEVRRLLAGYEFLDPVAKLVRMRALANLPEEAGVPALCRLVRYEKSPVLSKQAAMELLGSRPPGQPPEKELAEVLPRHLGPSRQAAAGWLLTWLRFRDDPGAALAEWAKLVEKEDSLLRDSCTQTDASIVAKLIRFQVGWFKRLDQKDQASAALQRLVDLETGNLQSLGELLSWLIGQPPIAATSKCPSEWAWDSVDKLVTRFPDQFANSPNLLVLLYTVAQTQTEQGDNNRAEQTVQRILKLNPGNTPQELIKHYEVALALWQRGLLRWAQREYRQIIDTAPPGNDVVMAAHSLLGEMLHDQGEELEAAKVLEGFVETAQKQPNLPAPIRARLPAIRSRMNYFFACHFESRNDRAQQRAYLDKGVAADPTDVDVLIARYRLPDQTPEYREETLKLIKRAADAFRQEIAHAPDDATPYNQFAWLVANTEGDLQAALEFSNKSIQLSPDSGGYYDTLAHVYFARGDYEEAVKTQTKAAQLEPYTRLIAKQLEVFRRKWEETKNQKQQGP